jgi:hypothetical protein
MFHRCVSWALLDRAEKHKRKYLIMANKFFAWPENAGQKVIHVVEEVPEAALIIGRIPATGQRIFADSSPSSS